MKRYATLLFISALSLTSQLPVLILSMTPSAIFSGQLMMRITPAIAVMTMIGSMMTIAVEVTSRADAMKTGADSLKTDAAS
jgi:hypothetical protein